MGYIPSRRRTGQRSQLWTSKACITIIKYFGKSTSIQNAPPIELTIYCSWNHPTDPPINMTTDLFCAEIPQDLLRTLFIIALKALQHPANLQFGTGCLDCPHSYHIRRPTIYRSWFPPVRWPRKTSRILCHVRNRCYNPQTCPTIKAREVRARTILLIAPVQRTIYHLRLLPTKSTLKRCSIPF